MSVQGYRGRLTFLWMVGFVLSIVEVLYLTVIVEVGPTATTTLWGAVLSHYPPYILAIFAFYFGGKSRTQSSNAEHSVAYGLAMTMSVIWNVLMVVLLLRACVDSGRTEDALRNVQAIMPKLAVFMVPALTFFFGKEPGAKS